MYKKIQEIDDKVVKNIIKYRSPWKNKIMITFSRLGNFGLIWLAFCMPFLIYPPWRLTGANMIFGVGLNQILCEFILKNIVKRQRPTNYLNDDEQLINRPRFYSFPSGHTAASFAVTGIVMLRCNIFTILFVLFCSVMIALSRVYLRVHYLSDVIAGAILGLIFGSASVSIFEKIISNFT